jgi:hypothetical protein
VSILTRLVESTQKLLRELEVHALQRISTSLLSSERSVGLLQLRADARQPMLQARRWCGIPSSAPIARTPLGGHLLALATASG